METITFYARHVTSEFDDDKTSPKAFDEVTRLCTIRAYRAALKYIRKYHKKGSHYKNHRSPDWRAVRSIVRKQILIVSSNYWNNFDFDGRMNSSQLRDEIDKLIYPLKNIISKLEERPLYVRQALNSVMLDAEVIASTELNNHYAQVLIANQTLKTACEALLVRKNSSNGSAIRYRNASQELSALWAAIYGRKFPLDWKTSKGSEREKASGVTKIFNNKGAEFIYLVLHEIGNRWVTVSQVESGLRRMKEER